jgi:hypothetical protein
MHQQRACALPIRPSSTIHSRIHQERGQQHSHPRTPGSPMTGPPQLVQPIGKQPPGDGQATQPRYQQVHSSSAGRWRHRSVIRFRQSTAVTARHDCATHDAAVSGCMKRQYRHVHPSTAASAVTGRPHPFRQSTAVIKRDTADGDSMNGDPANADPMNADGNPVIP